MVVAHVQCGHIQRHLDVHLIILVPLICLLLLLLLTFDELSLGGQPLWSARHAPLQAALPHAAEQQQHGHQEEERQHPHRQEAAAPVEYDRRISGWQESGGKRREIYDAKRSENNGHTNNSLVTLKLVIRPATQTLIIATRVATGRKAIVLAWPSPALAHLGIQPVALQARAHQHRSIMVD